MPTEIATKESTVSEVFKKFLKSGDTTQNLQELLDLQEEDGAYRFGLSAEGAAQNKKYQQAYLLAEEKGPNDRQVTELMNDLTKAWPSHPGVVENAINEAMEANDSAKAVEIARTAANAWAGFLKSAKVKSFKKLRTSGEGSLLMNQVLANYEFVLERAGELEEALEIAKLARALEPSDPENLGSAVISLSIRTGNYENALQELAEHQDSLAPYVLYGRALTYYALNQPENAQAAAQTALRQWPQVAQGLTREWTGPTSLPRAGEAVNEAQVLYGYYEVFGAAWQSVPGALDWLRNEEKSYQRSGGKAPQHVGLTRSGATIDGQSNASEAAAAQEQMLAEAKVVGEDEFVRFLEVTPNAYVYANTERANQVQEIHKEVFRQDMKQRDRIEALTEILKQWPGNADAAVSIARLLGSEKRYEEALDHLQNAIFDLQKFWPEDLVGRGMIDIDWPQNRPLLLAYAYMVSFCAEEGENEAATEFANDYLAVNPKDQYGVRQKAIEVAMNEGDNERALELISKASDDIAAYNLFGRALALFRLGRKEDAEQALQNAIQSRPKVYQELISDKHRMPANYNPSYVSYFSNEEAYNYNTIWGPLWRRTMGALAWLRKAGKKK